MLAGIVLILNALGGGGGVGIHLAGEDRHFCDLLQNDRVVDGLGRVPAPGEGAVAVADHGGDRHGIDAPVAEALHDGMPGVALVARVQLRLRQMAGAGDRPVEVVGVGGPVAGDLLAGLGPGDRVRAVGMDDAADLREGVIQDHVGQHIGGGVQRPLDPVALEVHDHQVLGLERFVVHAGGLDDEQAPLAVDAGDVAPGVGDETPARQLQIGLIDLLLEFF